MFIDVSKPFYDVSSNIFVVYKIIIGDYFYYGSSIDFNKRMSSHISVFSACRRGITSKKIIKALKKCQSVKFSIVSVWGNDIDMVDSENYFISININNPKCLNTNHTAYYIRK